LALSSSGSSLTSATISGLSCFKALGRSSLAYSQPDSGRTSARATEVANLTCERRFNPRSRDGSTVMRNKGAATSVLMMGSRLMLASVALNRSDWMTRAGRGLP
jgi:hypothetical protein